MINAMWSALENIASKTETHDSLISTLHAGHCHRPRRQKQSATWTIKSISFAHEAWRRALSSSWCTGWPLHRAKCGLPSPLSNQHRKSAGLLSEFKRNAFVTTDAAISSYYVVSVCIMALFKKKRYYLCDWRIPENIFQIEQSALGYCLVALWCGLCGLWRREKKGYGNGRGQREGRGKKRGKKLKLVKTQK